MPTVLPSHIQDAIRANNTSLGDNPFFPPKTEGQDFIESIVEKEYNSINKVENPIQELSQLMTQTIELEKGVKEGLEKLCSDLVTKLFEIPEDTIQIEEELSDTIDKSKQRLSPEEDPDFSFDDIDDMQYLGREIYKRRLLNSLVQGASEWWSYELNNYIQQLWKISPELPNNYTKIIELSRQVTYDQDETKLQEMAGPDGTVNVIMNTSPDMLVVKAQGIIFPILLQETIKGILEVAILQGLPEDKDKALFIMKKADFRMAEIWDSRLGLPLWKRIVDTCDKAGYSVTEVGLNFVLMELSRMETEQFTNVMQNVLAGTKYGARAMAEICESIVTQREEDKFNDYIDQQNQLYPIQDGYFTDEELIQDSVDLYELSSKTYQNAASAAYDKHRYNIEDADDRVKKFRQAAVDKHRQDKSHYGYNSTEYKEQDQDKYVNDNQDQDVVIFDTDYKSLQDLYQGVRQGRLLIHCREVDPENIPDRIYPEVGETVKDAYGIEYSEDDMPELIFASENFNWAQNYPGRHSSYSDHRNGVFFVDASEFVKYIGDGYVQDATGQIYLENDTPGTVETDDWFSEEPADVAGVMIIK